MKTKYKTVGDLIFELRKHHPKTILTRETQGHFRCVVGITHFQINEYERHLTTVSRKEFKIIKTGRKRKQVTITGLE